MSVGKRTVAATIAATIIVFLTGCGDGSSTSPVIATENGVTFSTLNEGETTYRVVEVDLQKAHLHLFWKSPAGDRYRDFKTLTESVRTTGQRVVFATNAGIFDPSFTPLGLHIEAGKQQVGLNLNDGEGNFYLKPNGVLTVNDQGARISDAALFPENPTDLRLAVQSGPLLLTGGQMHPAFAENSPNRRTRSGVGVIDPHRIVFVLSEVPVTFHEFATVFRSRLHCQDALYLDGQISKFYAPRAGWNDNSGDFAGMLAIIADDQSASPR